MPDTEHASLRHAGAQVSPPFVRLGVATGSHLHDVTLRGGSCRSGNSIAIRVLEFLPGDRAAVTNVPIVFQDACHRRRVQCRP